MENVVTVIFDVESEAYQAFSEIRTKPYGENYLVAEAALLKQKGSGVTVVEAFDAAGTGSDDTAMGMLLGSAVGILGGPIGMLLGAGTGALAGAIKDSTDVSDNVSMLEVTAAKLFEGEVAIVALVEETEPAFDAAFEGYQTTIIRHFAVDVMDEVETARELQADFLRQAKAQLHAERRAERKEKREERKQSVRAYFDELKQMRADNKAWWAAERADNKERFKNAFKKDEE